MHRAVVTSFDGNYFQYSMVLAKSFAENYNGTEPVDFICLVPLDLLDRELEYIKQLNKPSKLNVKFRGSEKFEQLAASGKYNFDLMHHITVNAMQRIFLASTLHEYDEVIYIDPDCMIVRDVQPLLNYPLVNKFLAHPESDGSSLIVFDDPDRPYFNNGVFITSLEYWRTARIEDQMLSYLTSDEYEPTACIEQDLMNRFLFDVWSPLPPSLNYRWEYSLGGPFRGTIPLVFHFVGGYKPWILFSDTNRFEAAWRTHYLEIFPNGKLKSFQPVNVDFETFDNAWKEKTSKLFPGLDLRLD